MHATLFDGAADLPARARRSPSRRGAASALTSRPHAPSSVPSDWSMNDCGACLAGQPRANLPQRSPHQCDKVERVALHTRTNITLSNSNKPNCNNNRHTNAKTPRPSHHAPWRTHSRAENRASPAPRCARFCSTSPSASSVLPPSANAPPTKKCHGGREALIVLSAGGGQFEHTFVRGTTHSKKE